MLGRRIAVAVGFAALMVASACRCGGEPEGGVKEGRSGVTKAVEYRALEVEFTGCHATTRVPLTCELRDEVTELRFWVAGSRHVPEVAVDGEVLEPVASIELIDGGHLVIVRVPKGGKQLAVTTGPEVNPGRWEVGLLKAPPNPVLDEVMAGLPPEGSREAKAAQASAAMQLRDALPSLTPRQQLEVRETLYLLERPERAMDEQQAIGQRLVEDALLAGRHETATHLARVVAFDLGRSGRLDEAGRLLDLERTYSTRTADAEAISLSHYHRGVLATRRHDARAALVELKQARRGFRRLGLARREQHAVALLVPRLGMLGQLAEQKVAVERLLALIDATPTQLRCDQAGHLNNAAWGVLLSARRGDSTSVARDLLGKALKLLDREECDPKRRPEWESIKSETLINAAIVATTDGLDEEAEDLLSRLSRREMHARQERWVAYLQAVVDDHRGRQRKARRLLEDLLAADALQYQDSLLAWRASVLLGRLKEDSGESAALDAYLAAEDALDQLVAAVGLDQGREGLLAGTYSSSSRAIRLLVEAGDFGRAARVAERARTRAYRSLGTASPAHRLAPPDRRQWATHLAEYRAGVERLEDLFEAEQLAAGAAAETLRREAAGVRESMLEHFRSAHALAESIAGDLEPRAPGDGELIIRVHPLQGSWIAFAIDDSGVVGSTTQGADGESVEEVARRLLAEFAPLILDSQGIVIQAAGPFAEVDVHAVEFQGEPLLNARPVEYSFGVGGRLGGPTGVVHSALVVADPQTPGRARLQSARLEGQEIVAALDQAGIDTELLDAGAADRASIQESLTRVDLFHFAGHGEIGAGEGWDSRLVFARGTNLDSRDILSLAAAPEVTVLLGCKTGYARSGGARNGMHLAAAFVLSGSERVISASRDIPDAVSRMLAAHLYRDGEITTTNAAARLRSAALELARQGHESWTAFRVVRP